MGRPLVRISARIRHKQRSNLSTGRLLEDCRRCANSDRARLQYNLHTYMAQLTSMYLLRMRLGPVGCSSWLTIKTPHQPRWPFFSLSSSDAPGAPCSTATAIRFLTLCIFCGASRRSRFLTRPTSCWLAFAAVGMYHVAGVA